MSLSSRLKFTWPGLPRKESEWHYPLKHTHTQNLYGPIYWLLNDGLYFNLYTSSPFHKIFKARRKKKKRRKVYGRAESESLNHSLSFFLASFFFVALPLLTYCTHTPPSYTHTHIHTNDICRKIINFAYSCVGFG